MSAKTTAGRVKPRRIVQGTSSRTRFLRSLNLYPLLIPGILMILIFHYLPMYGLVISFKKYNIFLGSNPLDAIRLSPWVGLKNWNVLWVSSKFRNALTNTLVISMMKIVFGFPIPVILALMLNEVRHTASKKVLQTVMYLPHFISWVVVGALFMNLLGTGGIANKLIESLGGEKQKFFMDNRWFRWILLFTSVWKNCGWNAIVYLAAITGIDPELYEASQLDGASRFQQTLHITLPGIAGTVVMMLILRLGSIMDAGFSQILVMYNPTVYQTGDIIGTYVYREGLGKLNWSQGTLVGLFNSVINMILMLGGNFLSRKVSDRSIW